MIDNDLIVRKLALIIDDMLLLEKFAQMSEHEYQSDPMYEAAAERYLERIIGRMIDINFHLITSSGKPPPKDYYQSFVDLFQCKIIPKTFSENIASAAGLRNRIVHEYDEIDTSKIFHAIQKALVDVPVYMDYISKYLESNGDKQ